MKDITLVIMAAGMGSRYGGLKQIDPVGLHGEIILDYSVYDAIEAGFTKVVFVIKHEIEKDFKEIIGNKYDGRIKVKLGMPEDISYKVRTAMTIILEKLDLNGTTTTEGMLDVSNCNSTKKSYFKEQSLIEAETQPSETTADGSSENEQTVENEYIDEDYDGYDDITGEIIPIEEEEEEVEETQAPISQDDWYL